MRAVLDLQAILIDEPEEGLMDECGRLEGVIATFAPEVASGPSRRWSW